MTLEWTEQAPCGWFLAHGAEDVYLIARTPDVVVLTRWPARSVTFGAAREAALNAIQLHGAYDVAPEAAAGVIEHMKQRAQQYESGQGLDNYLAWRR